MRLIDEWMRNFYAQFIAMLTGLLLLNMHGNFLPRRKIKNGQKQFICQGWNSQFCGLLTSSLVLPYGTILHDSKMAQSGAILLRFVHVTVNFLACQKDSD